MYYKRSVDTKQVINNFIMITMKTTVRARLAEVLKSSNMNVSELSKAAKVDYATVYRISTGETLNPSRKTLEPLASVLKVNTEWLHKGIGDRDAIAEDNVPNTPYRDYAIKQLEKRVHDKEEEAITWKKQYDMVWKRLEFFLERLPLEQMMGKLDPNEETGLLAS